MVVPPVELHPLNDILESTPSIVPDDELLSDPDSEPELDETHPIDQPSVIIEADGDSVPDPATSSIPPSWTIGKTVIPTNRHSTSSLAKPDTKPKSLDLPPGWVLGHSVLDTGELKLESLESDTSELSEPVSSAPFYFVPADQQRIEYEPVSAYRRFDLPQSQFVVEESELRHEVKPDIVTSSSVHLGSLIKTSPNTSRFSESEIGQGDSSPITKAVTPQRSTNATDYPSSSNTEDSDDFVESDGEQWQPVTNSEPKNQLRASLKKLPDSILRLMVLETPDGERGYYNDDGEFIFLVD